jgi:twitching motility two-component system response regulator PilG
LVVGFTAPERQMLDAVVKLSQRRQPPLHLLRTNEGAGADVVMVDAANALSTQWASQQSWLQNKVVIWVDAKPDTGRTVVARPIQWSGLPILLARVMEQATPVAVSDQASKSASNAVLVVDDSVAVRAQLRALLERRGITVTEADSAEKAIQVASSAFFPCILMDVIMPGVDGYEACRRIKASPQAGKKSHVVMLTSKTSPFDRIKGKMAGCDAYLSKPIQPDYLNEVISRYIAKPVG